MHSDPIADLLTRIRNGVHAKAPSVEVPYSKIKEEIVKILALEGFVESYEVTTETKFPSLRITMRYDATRRPLIHKINRISRPGLRVYRGSAEIKPKRSGLMTQIVSTSSGLMTDREARKRNIGGEVLCEVY